MRRRAGKKMIQALQDVRMFSPVISQDKKKFVKMWDTKIDDKECEASWVCFMSTGSRIRG